MKTIIASMQPKWCELITCGKKSIEVRKTAPKEVPFKVLMYCTIAKDRKKYTDEFDVPMETRKWMGNGKVIGEFVCDKVETYIADDFVGAEDSDGNIRTKPVPGEFGYWIPNEERTCLTYKEILEYGGGKNIYGWRISDLVIYDEPKELSGFYRYCGDEPTCKKCEYLDFCESECESYCECASPMEGYKPIKRPPQSWQYCMEVNK